jgi:hypothetical protein
MPYTGNGTKLTGNDALVQRATFDTVINGDAATPLAAGIYLILSVASPSGFPPNTTGDAIEAGKFLLVDVGTTIVPLVGDNVLSLTLSDLCDISDFAMEFTKPEIDVTTQCDLVRVYRTGKPDMSGTMNGIFTVGVSDDVDGFLRQFIDIVKQDGSTSYDVYDQLDSILLGTFYLNSDSDIADRMAVIAPFVLFSYPAGGEQDSPQAFSSTFRFSNLTYSDDTYEIEIRPTFYRWGTPSDT